MPLFHFSDDPGIEVFTPRPVRVPSDRGPGRDWLNGPLVWAIDEVFAPMYLFPRDCPRIVLFRLPTSTEADIEAEFAGYDGKAVAYIEADWDERLSNTLLYRYELPIETFESLDDAGMHVSRVAVTPLRMDRLELPDALFDAEVELQLIPRLTPLKGKAWNTSLHASGIRLRNAQGW